MPETTRTPRKTPRAPAATAAIAGLPSNGRVRAVIDQVLPAVDAGRFAVKRVVGDAVAIRAHCFTDGHDVLRVVLRWRREDDDNTHEVPMKPLGNDVWSASFVPPEVGRYRYTVTAWVDPFESWRHEMVRRVDPEDIRIAARVGALEISAGGDGTGGCQGDGGAPAYAPLPDGSDVLVGVASRGTGCGELEVYGLVPPAMCWIGSEFDMVWQAADELCDGACGCLDSESSDSGCSVAGASEGSWLWLSIVAFVTRTGRRRRQYRTRAPARSSVVVNGRGRDDY